MNKSISFEHKRSSGNRMTSFDAGLWHRRSIAKNNLKLHAFLSFLMLILAIFPFYFAWVEESTVEDSTDIKYETNINETSADNS